MGVSRNIKIDVISDFLCPWCYICHVELKHAITRARASGIPASIEVQYHPYILNPSLSCDKAIRIEDYFKEKFGETKWNELKDLIRNRGTNDGINFSFTGVMRQTKRAHRLVLKAWRVGGQEMQLGLLGLLFSAHFEQDKDIGDIDTLAGFAEEVKLMTKDEAATFLESTELENEIQRMSDDAQKKGIPGVPFTIIDGKWALSGGQTADVYLKIFEKLAKTDPIPPVPQPISPTVAATS